MKNQGPQATPELSASLRTQSVQLVSRYALWILGFVVILEFIVEVGLYHKSVFIMDSGSFRLRLSFILQILAWLVGRSKGPKLQAFLILAGLYYCYLIFPIFDIGSDATANAPEHYFLLPIMMLILGLLPLLMYDLNMDRTTLIGWQAVFISTFIIAFAVVVDRLAEGPEAYLAEMAKQNYKAGLGFFGCYVFVQVMIIQYKRAQYSFQNQIQVVHQVTQQNLLLMEKQNHRLKEQQQSLQHLQKEEGDTYRELEERVAERTEELEKQNKLFLEYNFMHSHVVKAPMARIKGLLQLLPLVETREERKEIESMMRKDFKEFNHAVDAIANVVLAQDDAILDEIRESAHSLYEEVEQKAPDKSNNHLS